jgi:hypothetical protein
MAAGLFICLLISCTGKKSGSSTAVSISLKRFEKDLFAISNYEMADSIPSLLKKYHRFLPLFGAQIIEIGHPQNPEFAERLLAFKSDFTIYRASKRVSEVFQDLTPVESELSAGFSKFHMAFPDRAIPDIITCISGFNQSIVIDDSLLVISLDKYLGSGESFYDLLYPPIPAYQRKVMFPGKIPSDALYAWIVTEFSFNNAKDNLLANMIFEGRAQYCLKQMLPEIPDTLLWGFTPDQIDFCRKNEKGIWEYLIEHQLLFVTDKFRMGQFINPAPFTKDFSQESPGQAANWIGYRIVSAYMKNAGSVSLYDLMLETDYLKISNLSKYNP